MDEAFELFTQLMRAIKAMYPHQYLAIGNALMAEWPNNRQLAWRLFVRGLSAL